MTNNSIVNALQNAKYGAMASNANVTINTGNGNSNINISANNVKIDTGCGDQNINVAALGNVEIDTGLCGTDNINVVANGNATISTYEDDDNIKLVCGGTFDIDSGVDYDKIKCKPVSDNDTVYVISTAQAGENYIATGNGNDIITVVANNVDIDKNTGTMLLGAIGSGYTVNSDASKNTVGFYGNKDYTFNFNAETSNNDVRTLDFWISDGSNGQVIEMNDGTSASLKDLVDDVQRNKGDAPMTLTEYDAKYNSEAVDFFKDTFGDMMNRATYRGQIEEDIKVLEKTCISSTDNKDEIIKKYNLNAQEAAILKSIDLTATMPDGTPKYAIAKSVKRNPNEYVIIARDWNGTKNGQPYYHGRSVSRNECIAFYSNGGSEEIVQQTTQTYDALVETAIKDVYQYGGVTNVNINQNDGRLNTFITATSTQGGDINITKGENCNKQQVDNRTIIGAYNATQLVGTYQHRKNITEDVQKIIGGLFQTDGSTWTSPLILDTNKDGQVSATAGMGVDVNGDGKVDGAATGGDKMLAMSDMNGNGKVDGSEVFGNETISPFSGKKISATNGFEALKAIAIEAEQYSGKKIVVNGEVNLQTLKAVLAEKGVTLGFISDNNVTTLEDLGDVKSINVANYQNNNDTSKDVQHRQLGSYTTVDGQTFKVDDVWFES